MMLVWFDDWAGVITLILCKLCRRHYFYDVRQERLFWKKNRLIGTRHFKDEAKIDMFWFEWWPFCPSIALECRLKCVVFLVWLAGWLLRLFDIRCCIVVVRFTVNKSCPLSRPAVIIGQIVLIKRRMSEQAFQYMCLLCYDHVRHCSRRSISPCLRLWASPSIYIKHVP